MKFKAPIEVQAGISDGDPTNPLGQAGYLLSSDGSNVNWVSPGGLSAETAEAIVQPIKADEALAKGDPLYIVGYQTGQDVNIVAKANSSDPTKMPVVGLADDDYANQAFGTMTAFGSFNGDFDTTGPGTETWVIGDIIFVKPGGGLTNIKPGGTDLIQNVAIVSRVNSQTGELEVIALGRTNDVPNLPTGRLFVGTATNTSLISDVVYVDDANDRVGIGTTSPSTVLEVSSSGVNGVDISQSASNATQSGRLFFTTNTASEGFALFNANGTFQVNSGGIPNDTSGTNRISIIGSSGKVGIGTTSPQSILHVSDANPEFILEDTTNPNKSKIKNTDGSLRYEADYNSQMGNSKHQFFIDGSEKLRITSAGNVGIGTTSPDSKLNIEGPKNTAILTLGNTTTGSSWVVGDRVGGIDFYSGDGSGGGIGVKASISYEDAVGGSGSSQAMVFRTGGNTPGTNNVERMRLQYNGNVGIGTTSPTEKLEVEDSGTLGVNKDVLSITNRVPTSPSVDTTVGMNFNLQQGSNSAIPYGAIQVGEHSGTGSLKGSMRFLVQEYAGGFNLDEKMRIESNGNVGIGTTDPNRLLTVETTGSGCYLALNSSSNNTTIGSDVNGAFVVYDDSSATYRMIIDQTTGNIGVNTTSPSKKLDVNGSLGCTSFEMGNLKMSTAFSSIFINGTTSGNTIFYGVPASFTQNLQVQGTVTCVNLVQTSQTDKKKDISNIDKSKAKTIQFKEYKYKEGDGGRKRYGVLVEDLENDYPELVHVGADGVKGINYIDLLVKRVAELEKELEDISLTPGPKGDTGTTGAQGPAGADGRNGSDGRNGADGNDHLKNVRSIAFNEKSGQLEITIEGHKNPFIFNPAK